MGAVPAMPTSMAAMEEVQKRTRQEEQVREHAEHVSGVLRYEEESRDPEKSQQHETRA